MKVTLNRAELLSSAKRGESIAPHDSALDVLKGLLLEFDSGGGILTMTATNLEITLEQKISCASSSQSPLYSERPGGHSSCRSLAPPLPTGPTSLGSGGDPGDDAFVLNARLAVSMLEKLSGDAVELERIPGKPLLHLRSGDAEYLVPIYERSSYPKLEMPFPEDTVKVSGIPGMAKRTVFAAAQDDSKPLMKCVNLKFTKDGLRAAVGNGSCIVTAKGDDKSTGDVSLLVPAFSLEKLARLCGDKDEFRVGTTGKAIVFLKENFAFSARLLEGNYINVEGLIGSIRNQFTVLSGVEELRKALDAASCVDSDGKVCLRFEGQRITFHCESEHGNTAVPLDVIPLTGVPQGEYWYISKQLMSCLKSLAGTVKLGIAQSGMLTLEADDAYYLQIGIRAPSAEEKPTAVKKKKASAPKAA